VVVIPYKVGLAKKNNPQTAEAVKVIKDHHAGSGLVCRGGPVEQKSLAWIHESSSVGARPSSAAPVE
jgi:hypothetical protein